MLNYDRYLKYLMIFNLFFLILVTPYRTVSAEIISLDRRIQWNPGTRSDLTLRTTIYKTIQTASQGDDTNAIKNALNSCPTGQVVVLGSGTFTISSTINWPSTKNITLRGQGSGNTILLGTSNFSGDKFFRFDNGASYSWPSSKTLAAEGLTKGSTQINTTTSHGWRTGDYVLLDQDNDESIGWTDSGEGGECNWCSRLNGERLLGQVVQVTVVDSNTVNIDPPLYYSYSTAQLAQASIFNGIIEGASLEGFTINNHASDCKTTLYVMFVFNSLFYDIDMRGTPATGGGAHVQAWGGLWNTFRKCFIGEAEGNQSNMGYGIFERMGTSAFLIEDCIFDTLQMAIAWEGTSSGNVFAYNHTINSAWYDNTANRLMVLAHGGGGYMNLVESNVIEGRFRLDYYWGTSMAYSLFRNRIEQMPNKSAQTWCVDLEKYGRHCNVVGNVLGTNGYEYTYEIEGQTVYSEDRGIYKFGYEGAYDGGASGNDGEVLATLLRHGNWDSVTKSTVWDSEIADRNLPPSLYLTSKPSWWGNLAWPAIGPDLSPMDGMIPAQARYLGIYIDLPPLPPSNFIRVVNP